MCCPLGICVALWCKSFEKFNIKSPKAPKHGIFFFFASVKIVCFLGWFYGTFGLMISIAQVLSGR